MPSGKVKLVMIDGKVKNFIACVTKSRLKLIQQSNVALLAGQLKWIQSADVKTIEQHEADSIPIKYESFIINGNGQSGEQGNIVAGINNQNQNFI